jgi:hypothetical protein
MDRHEVEHLLTFNDRDFKRFVGIKVVHPENIETLSQV